VPWIALGVFVVVVLIILAAVVLMVNPAQAADARSPFDYGVLTYLWVLCLSAFGGIVNFSRKLRDSRTTPFRLTEFIGELATSTFAGLLTFWLCESAGVDRLIAACCIAISGHMGSRAVFKIERFLESKMGGAVTAPAPEPDPDPAPDK
jgi:peptidoglycan/LPS O-acetylase OafA/YrhL